MNVVINLREKRMIILGFILSSIASIFTIASSGVYSGIVMIEFNAMSLFTLVFVMESLFRCIMLPFAGKLGDIYGRKNLYLTSITLYGISALICGFSINVFMFIIGRALMGLTWGLFQCNTFAMIGDIYDEKTRPGMIGLLQSVNIAVIIFAGVLSGFLIDIWNWRVIFFLIIPLLFCAVLLIFKFFPKTSVTTEKQPFDYTGMACTILILGSFVFALFFGGNVYPWISTPVLGLLLIGLFALVVLTKVEKKAVDPLFPAALFKNRNYMLVFLMSLCFISVTDSSNYLPSFAQNYLKTSAAISGMLAMPANILGICLALIVGRYIAKKEIYKKLLLVLGVCALVASVMCFIINATTPLYFIMMICAFIGIAQAINQVLPITFAQSSLPYSMIGSATAFIGFGQVLGNTLAMSVYGVAANSGFLNVFKVPVFFSILILIFVSMFREKTKIDSELVLKPTTVNN